MWPARFVALALLSTAAIWCDTAAADLDIASVDGWHSWQIDETGQVVELCCFTRKRGVKSQKGCHLDGNSISYGHQGDCAAKAGRIQFYARIESGRPTRILALSSQCPVTAKSEIRNLGIVSAQENIDWFRSVIEDRSLDQDVREEALFGLVQSESETAYDYIDRLLSSR